MLARFAGDGNQASESAEASVRLYEREDRDDPAGLAFALFQRAAAEVNFAAEWPSAKSDLERGVDCSSRAGDRVVMGLCLNMLGVMAWIRGDFGTAEARFLEALATGRALGSSYLIILYLANLSSVRTEVGRWSDATLLTREATELAQASKNRHFAPGCVIAAARILAAAGDVPNAWRLFGAAKGMWAQIGEIPSLEDIDGVARQLELCSVDGSAEEYARLQDDGAKLGFDVAIAETLMALRRFT
jgi:hypothetical protein